MEDYVPYRNKRKRKKKRWFILAGVVLALLFLLRFSLGGLIVKKGLELAAKKSGLEINVSSGGISFLNGINIYLADLVVMGKGDKDPKIMVAQRVKVKIGMWSLLGGDLNIRSLEMGQGEVSIVKYADGSLNIPKKTALNSIFKARAAKVQIAGFDSGNQPLKIEEIVFKQFSVHYQDHISGLDIWPQGIDLKAVVDITPKDIKSLIKTQVVMCGVKKIGAKNNFAEIRRLKLNIDTGRIPLKVRAGDVIKLLTSLELKISGSVNEIECAGEKLKNTAFDFLADHGVLAIDVDQITTSYGKLQLALNSDINASPIKVTTKTKLKSFNYGGRGETQIKAGLIDLITKISLAPPFIFPPQFDISCNIEDLLVVDSEKEEVLYQAPMVENRCKGTVNIWKQVITLQENYLQAGPLALNIKGEFAKFGKGLAAIDFGLRVANMLQLKKNIPTLAKDIPMDFTSLTAQGSLQGDRGEIRELNAELGLKNLRYEKTEIDNIKGDLSFKDKLLKLDPLSGNILGGTFLGVINSNFQVKPVQHRGSFRLQGLEIGQGVAPYLLLGANMLGGKASLEIPSFQARGMNKKEILKTLQVKSNFSVRDGEIKDIKELPAAKQLVAGSSLLKMPLMSFIPKTHRYSIHKAPIQVKDGRIFARQISFFSAESFQSALSGSFSLWGSDHDVKLKLWELQRTVPDSWQGAFMGQTIAIPLFSSRTKPLLLSQLRDIGLRQAKRMLLKKVLKGKKVDSSKKKKGIKLLEEFFLK